MFLIQILEISVVMGLVSHMCDMRRAMNGDICPRTVSYLKYPGERSRDGKITENFPNK